MYKNNIHLRGLEKQLIIQNTSRYNIYLRYSFICLSMYLNVNTLRKLVEKCLLLQRITVITILKKCNVIL